MARQDEVGLWPGAGFSTLGPVRCFRCVVWLCGLLLCANGALAEDPASASDEEGRGFFIAGRAAFLAGRYAEALERFERSYEMSGRAELLYNIGAAAERAGEQARALKAYQEFQDKRPDSEVHAEVDARIRELETRLDTKPEAIPDAAPAPPPPLATHTETSEPKSALGPSLSLASSGAVLASGVVLAVLGFKAEQRVHEAPDGAHWADYQDDADRAIAFRAAGFTLGAVGVVGAVLSTWWLVRTRKDARTSALIVGRTFIGYRGSF